MRRPPANRRVLIAVVTLAATLAPVVGRAQLVTVPTFDATASGTSNGSVDDPDVAAGADGSIMLTWSELPIDPESTNGTTVVIRRFSAAGVALGPAARIDSSGSIVMPKLAADTRGGFVASWRQVGQAAGPLLGRYLDATGATVTSVLGVSQDPGATRSHGVAGLPSGAVFAWLGVNSVAARLYDTSGAPGGPAFTVYSGGLNFQANVAVAAGLDGGFVITWNGLLGGFGRRYDAAGTPVEAATLLTNEFVTSDVAFSPLGGFTVAGLRSDDDYVLPSGVWIRRFDPSGAPLGPAALVATETPSIAFSAAPEVAYDPEGHLYVAWTGLCGDMLCIRGRGYDANGAALGPPFRVSSTAGYHGASAVRPDGSFANAWKSTVDLQGNAIALCTPPYHTGCGDGTVTAPCETCDAGSGNSDTLANACRTNCHKASCGDGVVDTGEECDDGNGRGCDGCDRSCHLEPGYACGDGVVSTTCGETCDDGVGNSDTTPDACRTSCRLAACGDGVTDGSEECDDGNRKSCDGCSSKCVAEPGLQCGDGIPQVECGEQCDDGNTIDGDGCTEPCRLEVIPGGGPPGTDCRTVWVVDNPANDPRYDKKGAISGIQQCVDGDSRCDFDAGVAGSCTFHVRVCANTNTATCFGAVRLATWTLKSPSSSRAANSPALAAVRSALASVAGTIVGPDLENVCTPTIAVTVPLRTAAGRLVANNLALKTEARPYSLGKDVDKLKLVCLPAN